MQSMWIDRMFGISMIIIVSETLYMKVFLEIPSWKFGLEIWQWTVRIIMTILAFTNFLGTVDASSSRIIFHLGGVKAVLNGTKMSMSFSKRNIWNWKLWLATKAELAFASKVCTILWKISGIACSHRHEINFIWAPCMNMSDCLTYEYHIYHWWLSKVYSRADVKNTRFHWLKNGLLHQLQACNIVLCWTSFKFIIMHESYFSI